MNVLSAIFRNFYKFNKEFLSSIHPPALDFEQGRSNPLRHTSAILDKKWHLVLLVVLLSSFGISGCGGFTGTQSGSAAAGLLIALPNNVDFGSVPVGQTATASVSVTNKSSNPIEISQLTFTGQSFSIANPSSLPVSLAAGKTLKVSVQFGPTASGTAQGQLAITSSLSTSPAVVVHLTGKGTAASAPTLSINATTVSFGDVTLNTPSTQTVTLTSTGASPVTVNSATTTGAGFSVSGPTLPATLNKGQSLSLNVQFDPTVAGAASGQLTISSDSSTNPTATISLTGNGVAPTTTVAHEVDLTWSAPTSSPDPVAGYNVYRAPSGTGSYQLLNSGVTAQTQYADLAVQSGASYDYVVKSVDATGVESPASNVTTATIP